MKIDIEPGIYILAVSGGVDSMVLLDILSQKPHMGLIVAHFDHGIRPDGDKDEKLVRKTVEKYGLKFEAGQGNLGLKASEDKARQARYNFLKSIQKKYQARAIITAHHQDDLIETALLNIIRGTGVRGLTAIKHNPVVVRPLLATPKEEIMEYARVHKLEWREDETNLDSAFLRNYIRHQLMPKLSPKQRQQLLKNIDNVAKIEKQTDALIATISHNIAESNHINRQEFIQLPTEVANQLILHWLRGFKAKEPDRRTVQRLAITIKTAKAGTVHNVRKGLWLVAEQTIAYFTTTVSKGLV